MKNTRIFACDFETTVFENQTYTECWSCAYAELYSDNKAIYGNITDFFNYFFNLRESVILYFHNLKFDGSFIIDWLLSHTNIRQSIAYKSDNLEKIVFNEKKKMRNNEFIYLIDERGGWYSITIKKNNIFITIRDSLKLLPFSLKQIGESFKTEHKKLEMEYNGFRYANCPISNEEERYIYNDVLVLKEALEKMFDEGHNKITIGACCLAEFKKTFLFKEDYQNTFPTVRRCSFIQ